MCRLKVGITERSAIATRKPRRRRAELRERMLALREGHAIRVERESLYSGVVWAEPVDSVE